MSTKPPADKTYRYSGPNGSATIAVMDDKRQSVDRDVMLWQGREVQLPPEHAYTQQLLAQGLLQPLAVSPGAAVTPTAARKTAAAPTAAPTTL